MVSINLSVGLKRTNFGTQDQVLEIVCDMVFIGKEALPMPDTEKIPYINNSNALMSQPSKLDSSKYQSIVLDSYLLNL